MRESERVKLKRLMDMGKSKEEILEAMKPNKRRDGHKVPDGGINISEASGKYNISRTTLTGWVLANYIPTLKKFGRERYIPENIISEIAKRYDRHAPRGNRQILQILSDITSK